MTNDEKAVKYAVWLGDYCDKKHWTCCECPFYAHQSSQCLLYSPRTWESRKWQEAEQNAT